LRCFRFSRLEARWPHRLQKFFARDRQSRVKSPDASDGAAHRKVEKKKGRAAP
jgi:hypothetical protein